MVLLFGGKSAEHTVSIMGAKNIYNELKDDFDIELVAIDINGKMREIEEIPSDEFIEFLDDEPNIPDVEIDILNEADIVFPLLHGSFGEDGRIQGLLEMMGVPFVGEKVFSSAIAIDKDFTKRVLQTGGIPVVPWKTVYQREYDPEGTMYPVFVKPARQGSSIGITKVKREKQFDLAIKEALNNDDKLIIEEYIRGRELECSILGERVSGVGEVIPSHEFYDYEAKYFDDGKSVVQIPAQISDQTKAEIQRLTKEIKRLLGIKAISRVDFFLDENETIYLNEVNTMPGFTQYSMYAGLWKNEGVSFKELLLELVRLAMEKE